MFHRNNSGTSILAFNRRKRWAIDMSSLLRFHFETIEDKLAGKALSDNAQVQRTSGEPKDEHQECGQCLHVLQNRELPAQ